MGFPVFDADILIDQCAVDLTVHVGCGQFIQPILTVLMDREGHLLATSLDVDPPASWTALELLRDAVTRQRHSEPSPTQTGQRLRVHIAGRDSVSWEVLRRALPTSWAIPDERAIRPNSGDYTSALLGQRLSSVGFRHTSAALSETSRRRRAETTSQRAMTILQAREAITGLFSDRYESHSPYLRLRPQQRDAFLSTAEIVFLAISPQSIHGRHPAAAGPVAARMPPAVARLRDRPTTVDLTRVADTDRDEIRRRLAAIDRFLLADGRRGVARTEARQLGIPKHAFYRLVRTWRSSKSPESLLAVPRISAVDPMTDSQPPRQRHMKQQNKIADSE